jgi:hypothetical protein
MRALRDALENQAVLKTRGTTSGDMTQSSTWCYQREGSSGIRVNYHDAAENLDSLKKARPASARLRRVMPTLGSDLAWPLILNGKTAKTGLF